MLKFGNGFPESNLQAVITGYSHDSKPTGFGCQNALGSAHQC
jgi:hypothetical protein